MKREMTSEDALMANGMMMETAEGIMESRNDPTFDAAIPTIPYKLLLGRMIQKAYGELAALTKE